MSKLIGIDAPGIERAPDPRARDGHCDYPDRAPLCLACRVRLTQDNESLYGFWCRRCCPDHAAYERLTNGS